MRKILISILFALIPIETLGQDFDEGLAAYDAGDYTTAIQEWTPLAEAGNSSAQNGFGVMYNNGEGVLQDNVMAHMWYNIGSANGHDKASEWRDERAGLMTTAAIETAQSMARECMSSNYTKCGY